MKQGGQRDAVTQPKRAAESAPATFRLLSKPHVLARTIILWCRDGKSPARNEVRRGLSAQAVRLHEAARSAHAAERGIRLHPARAVDQGRRRRTVDARV